MQITPRALLLLFLLWQCVVSHKVFANLVSVEFSRLSTGAYRDAYVPTGRVITATCQFAISGGMRQVGPAENLCEAALANRRIIYNHV